MIKCRIFQSLTTVNCEEKIEYFYNKYTIINCKITRNNNDNLLMLTVIYKEV